MITLRNSFVSIHWKFIIRFALTFWMWYCIPAYVNVKSEISLETKTYSGFEPLDVKGKVIIEPHTGNRGACLVWDSADLTASVGSDCWTLEGDQAPKTKFFELKRLQAGYYQLQAILYRGTEELRSRVVEIRVLGHN